MMEGIHVRNVTKSYGPTDGIEAVSLSFDPGTVNALLGPNGSGKTTLFRVILGLTTPDAGTVSVPDVPVGCAFQHPQYVEGLTVDENLQLFGSLTDARPDWRETLVDRCGLDRVRHRLAEDLSGGFQKRLDVALALVDRPGVLLLDEPFADVDDAYRTQIKSLLADYLDDDDRICIVTTHQFDVVEPMLDTVTVVADGQVRARTDTATLDANADAVEAYYHRALDDANERPTTDRDHVDD